MADGRAIVIPLAAVALAGVIAACHEPPPTISQRTPQDISRKISQEAAQETSIALSNGLVVRLSEDKKAAILREDGQERVLTRTEAPFLRLRPLVNHGAHVGVAVTENWEDGYHFSIFTVLGRTLVRTVSFESASPDIGAADWDGDGDLEISAPGSAGLSDLLFAGSTMLAVYELDAAQVRKASIACFPALVNHMNDAVESLESRYELSRRGGQSLVIDGVTLTNQDMARMPAFLDGIREAINGRCERANVPR